MIWPFTTVRSCSRPFVRKRLAFERVPRREGRSLVVHVARSRGETIKDNTMLVSRKYHMHGVFVIQYLGIDVRCKCVGSTMGVRNVPESREHMMSFRHHLYATNYFSKPARSVLYLKHNNHVFADFRLSRSGSLGLTLMIRSCQRRAPSLPQSSLRYKAMLSWLSASLGLHCLPVVDPHETRCQLFDMS